MEIQYSPDGSNRRKEEDETVYCWEIFLQDIEGKSHWKKLLGQASFQDKLFNKYFIWFHLFSNRVDTDFWRNIF